MSLYRSRSYRAAFSVFVVYVLAVRVLYRLYKVEESSFYILVLPLVLKIMKEPFVKCFLCMC